MTKVKSIAIAILLTIFGGITGQTAADESASSDEISVLVVGDITIGSRMTPLIESKGAGVFFQGTTDLIQSADVATASLNASISERGEPRYGIEHPFRAAPGLGRAIANAGFDAVSLATPHIMDFGLEALEDTITELEWYDVKPIGAGTTAETAKLPAYVPVRRGETETARVALLAYYRMNEFARYTEDPLAYAVYSEMTNAVEQIRTKAALVVVWLHWGSRSQVLWMRQSADSGFLPKHLLMRGQTWWSASNSIRLAVLNCIRTNRLFTASRILSMIPTINSTRTSLSRRQRLTRKFCSQSS